MKKKDWEVEVEHILKEGSFNSRLQAFAKRFDEEDITPTEEWQDVFNGFFEELVGELPSFACYVLAFKAGQIWQKYQGELG